MAIEEVRVPLYNSSGRDKSHELIISEFAGRMSITIRQDVCNVELHVECEFDDVNRAWNAVKRH